MADLDLQSLDWRQAIQIFQQIRNLLPDDERARTSLIDLNFKLGQGAQALAELDHYLSYLWSNGLKEAAIRFVEGQVEENPDQAAIRRRLAELYRQVGRTEEAVAQLDEAGDILLKLGDKAGAVEAIRAILSLQPEGAEKYQQLLAQLKSP
jgi:tetratricopeptide (TPR) repeat protein